MGGIDRGAAAVAGEGAVVLSFGVGDIAQFEVEPSGVGVLTQPLFIGLDGTFAVACHVVGVAEQLVERRVVLALDAAQHFDGLFIALLHVEQVARFVIGQEVFRIGGQHGFQQPCGFVVVAVVHPFDGAGDAFVAGRLRRGGPDTEQRQECE